MEKPKPRALKLSAGSQVFETCTYPSDIDLTQIPSASLQMSPDGKRLTITPGKGNRIRLYTKGKKNVVHTYLIEPAKPAKKK